MPCPDARDQIASRPDSALTSPSRPGRGGDDAHLIVADQKGARAECAKGKRSMRQDPPSHAAVNRWPSWLALLHLLLFSAHAVAAAAVYGERFAFRITISETTLRSSSIDDFHCVYSYARTKNGQASYLCDDIRHLPNQSRSAPPSCAPSLDAYNSSGVLPIQDKQNGVSLAAYTLTRLSWDTGRIETSSKRNSLARWLLLAIASITSFFHLLYSILFARIAQEMKGLRWPITDYMMFRGGLPLRWVEYALTASAMALFTANTAAVFDLYALLGIVLGSFALMFTGMTIEEAAFRGHVQSALLLTYVPGGALFALTWAPSIRQLYTDVHRLGCLSWRQDPFGGCSSPSCFGEEVPITTFVLLLCSLFAVFPLIVLFKIYVVGGWADSWTGRFRPVYAPPENKIAFGIRAAGYATLNLVLLGMFVLWGGALAISSVLSEILYPLTLRREKYVTNQSVSSRKCAFWVGELMYAVASALSKATLFLFFFRYYSAGRE